MAVHLKYLRYVLRHKWFVFVEGRKLGVPLLALLIHDWTKFLPSEWGPYARFFNGGPYPDATQYHGDERNRILNGRTKQSVKAEFDQAWLSHLRKNRHHWQHWLLVLDSGEMKILPMPSRDATEMVADWRGAGQAQGNHDLLGWYRQRADTMALHPDTRSHIEQLLPSTSLDVAAD